MKLQYCEEDKTYRYGDKGEKIVSNERFYVVIKKKVYFLSFIFNSEFETYMPIIESINNVLCCVPTKETVLKLNVELEKF